MVALVSFTRVAKLQPAPADYNPPRELDIPISDGSRKRINQSIFYGSFIIIILPRISIFLLCNAPEIYFRYSDRNYVKGLRDYRAIAVMETINIRPNPNSVTRRL